jgi:hypothetical protein
VRTLQGYRAFGRATKCRLLIWLLRSSNDLVSAEKTSLSGLSDSNATVTLSELSSVTEDVTIIPQGFRRMERKSGNVSYYITF